MVDASTMGQAVFEFVVAIAGTLEPAWLQAAAEIVLMISCLI